MACWPCTACLWTVPWSGCLAPTFLDEVGILSSEALTIGGLREETCDFARPTTRLSSDVGSGFMLSRALGRSFVTSRRSRCFCGLLCLCLCVGQVHGHDQPLDGQNRLVVTRVFADARRRCAQDARGPERLTSRCGSCWPVPLTHPLKHP